MVGRLDENKNQSLVMEAFSEVLKEGYKDYQLKLFGDGPDMIKLRHLAINLGIEKHVSFVGVVQVPTVQGH